MAHEIERIVVPLDAASETATAIDTAMRLAARWHVPVHGVFVEDEELIGLAGLPFARQVTLGAGLEPLTKDHVEDQFRAAAERAWRELAAAAERHDVKSTFEVVRGPLTADMLAGEHDLVVAGATTRPIGGYFRLCSRGWSWMKVAARPFLLAKRAWETGGSVFTLLRGRGAQSAQTLDIAAQIAGFHSRSLTVAGAFDLAASEDFAAWVSGLLEGHSLNLRMEREALKPAALRQRILELDCRLLVLEAGEQDGRTEDLRELVEHLTCDVLIVR
jgi:nucleotide-binding universal stress UspA family protein